jgi:hypothetical protein
VTDPSATRDPLPPDPTVYDSERNKHARARGLPGPVIVGGTDPDPEAGLREERKYLRLLVWMVVAIVLAGFVFGLAITLAAGA